MKKNRENSLLTLFTFISTYFLLTPSFACTNFNLKANDGSIIVGRSMEFGLPMNSNVVVYPRGEKFSSHSPKNKPGLSWTSKYGFIAMTAIEREGVTDGFNEMGFSVGFLWLPETEYQSVDDKDSARAVEILDLGAWILSQFSSLDEVKENIKSIRIWGDKMPQLGKKVPPLHLIIQDIKGNSLVIEFIRGEVKIYDNPIGILTNSPTFDWHLTNLRNYINLTAANSKPMTINKLLLEPTGQGTGLHGIPGSWTPPDRFIRATFFKTYAQPPKTAADGVNLAQHILNTVDIPFGDIRDIYGKNSNMDYTQWVVIKDLKNKMLYFRTYKNLTLRSIDLKQFSLGPGSGIRFMPTDSLEGNVVDVTNKIHTSKQ